jgi:hypothetical protein
MTVWYAYINTVISPDDGHRVALSMYRKEINILRKIVHEVGFIYKTSKKILGQLATGRNFELWSSAKRNTRSDM